MKLRSTQSNEVFEADLTGNHADSIAGGLALQRRDTGIAIVIQDIFSLSPERPYDILESTPTEQLHLKDAGIILFGTQCYMDMDQETKEAILADLNESLAECRNSARKIISIQLNHRRFLPVLGDLRPLSDASAIVEDEIKRMIALMESR